MEVILTFVYYNDKKNKIKALSLNEAKEKNDELLSTGWKHTATLDPCKWIEYLFNQTKLEDIIAEISDLSTTTKRSKSTPTP